MGDILRLKKTRLQGRAPGFRQGQDRDKIGTRQGQDREKTGTRQKRKRQGQDKGGVRVSRLGQGV